MELTTGWILVFIGIVGIVGCTAALNHMWEMCLKGKENICWKG